MKSAEILGLCASVVILISGMMKGEKRLRTIDAIGSFMMTVYGIWIGAFAVWFLNGSLMFAHLFRLWQIRKSERENGSDRILRNDLKNEVIECRNLTPQNGRPRNGCM